MQIFQAILNQKYQVRLELIADEEKKKVNRIDFFKDFMDL